MSIISFKARRKAREKMEKYKDKIRELEAEENMRKIIEELKKKLIQAPKGFSAASIKENRDSH